SARALVARREGRGGADALGRDRSRVPRPRRGRELALVCSPGVDVAHPSAGEDAERRADSTAPASLGDGGAGAAGHQRGAGAGAMTAQPSRGARGRGGAPRKPRPKPKGSPAALLATAALLALGGLLWWRLGTAPQAPNSQPGFDPRAAYEQGMALTRQGRFLE